MFLRAKIRHKDGKAHRAWSVVENRRVQDGRVVQRQVLYLGEINDSQRAAWSKAIEVFDEGAGQPKQIALFPEDRVAPALDCDVVSIRLSEMRLRRPRQWGACWMATLLWDQLRLDEFWFAALPPSREGTNWLNILKTLVGYQLISPGSEWRLHRHWFEHSAMGDLLGEDLALVQPNNLYRCLDKLTAHKQAMFTFLGERWKELFQADFEVLLYDLKSPSFYSRCQAENPHILRVLAIGDEFRERIGFCGTHEKFGKCLAQRFCNDELRWRNAGTNGSQPGSERVPNELGSNDGEILEESLGDDAGLDEGMISAHFAFDTGAVVGRFAM